MTSLTTISVDASDQTRSRHDPLDVWYIIMAFPSETFAANDVLALRRTGMNVSVHALRVEPRDAMRLAKEQGVLEVPTSHNGVGATLVGLGLALARPLRTGRLLAWLARHTGRRPGQFLRSLALVPRALQLVDCVRRRRPDVVHLFWGHYPAIVGHLVRTEVPETRVSMFLGAYDLSMRFGASGPVARAADVVWTHASVNIEAIVALGVAKERVHVAFRGIDLRRSQDVAHSGVKIPGRIVSAGRLIASKAMDDVLRVFAAVHAARPASTLVIIGDGPDRDRLKRMVTLLGIDSAVSFLGQVSQKRVIEEMKNAEVFLFMSKKNSERLPNVVKEAMSVRCLCVATDTPGMGELIEDGRHGVVVPPGDLAGAEDAVVRALSDRQWREELAEAAFEHLASVFDVDRAMHAYRQGWERLVKERRERHSAS